MLALYTPKNGDSAWLACEILGYPCFCSIEGVASTGKVQKMIKKLK